MDLELGGKVAVVTGASKGNVGGVRLRVDGFLATTDADFEASLQLNFFSALRPRVRR